MAANRRKTIEFAAPTRITSLATNTTLATATRHDTAAFTLSVPEVTSRAFLSAKIVLTYHSAYTVSNTVTGWRVGIKLGAAAAVDTDRAPSAHTTASKDIFDVIEHDVTSYFNTNFGAGISQTCVVSFACATTTVDAVNQITAKLVLTYEFDSTGQDTRIQTMRIPIQSLTTALTAVQQELGIDSTNPVGSGQIPALDTFLPEASKVYRQIFLELGANTNTTAATSYTPFIQIDATAEVARATIAETLFTAKEWRDIYDLTGLITTNATHTVKMRCDLTGRLQMPGGFLVVTYEYSVAATLAGSGRMICEAVLPMAGSAEDNGLPFGNTSFSTSVPADATTWVALLDVPEASPTLVQSGIVMIDVRSSAATANVIRAGGQVYRSYAVAGVTAVTPGIHRCDHGTSPWTVARGPNRLVADVYTNSISSRGNLQMVAIVNYTATMPADPDAATHTVNFQGNTFAAGAGAQAVDIAAQLHVPVLGAPYRLSGALLDSYARTASATASGQFLLAQKPGEFDGHGFLVGDSQPTQVNANTVRQVQAWTRSLKPHSLAPAGKIDIEVDRRIVRYSPGAATLLASWSWWLTYHQLSFTVAGTVTVDGAAAPNGKTVRVIAVDAAGVAELVTTTATGGGTGAFAVAVLDSTRTYHVEYADTAGGRYGASADGTPGASTFNVTVGGVLGGGDATPPTLTVVSPAAGAALGASYAAARDAAVTLQAVDAASAIAFVVISVQFSDRAQPELVYAGTGTAAGFAAGYAGASVVTGTGAAGVGYTFAIRRAASWPAGVGGVAVGATFVVSAVDAAGNVLT